MLGSLEQKLNALLPILLSLEIGSKVMLVRPAQLLKVLSPIPVTPLGIMMLDSLGQVENADTIFVKFELGSKATLVRLLQFWNEPLILVTLLGIVKPTRPVHRPNVT